MNDNSRTEGIRQLTSTEARARILEGLVIGMGFIGGGAVVKASVRVTAIAVSIWATGAVGTVVGQPAASPSWYAIGRFSDLDFPAYDYDLFYSKTFRAIQHLSFWSIRMLSHSDITKPSVGPVDLQMLHGILTEWYAERGCEIDNEPAHEAAREAISWFECGIKDKNRILQLVRCI